MISKHLSKRLLQEQQKQREIRKAQIAQAIKEVMITSTGIRRESFNAVDLAVKLKTIDVDDLNNWTYDSAKKTIEELVRSGDIIELERGKRYISAGNRE